MRKLKFEFYYQLVRVMHKVGYIFLDLNWIKAARFLQQTARRTIDNKVKPNAL